jgi:uroporphyrinogen III methyltransferase/synthase
MASVAHAEGGASGPLSGRAVVITRASEQAAAIAEPLAALGAEVVPMPLIEIAPPESWDAADDAIDRLDRFDWLVLTSVNGVDAFEERLRLHGLRLADLAGRRVAVVGSATASRLREHGVEPVVVPEQARAEGLVEALAAIGPGNGGRVLIARAAEGREVLPDELRALGFTVEVVPVYRVVSAAPPLDVLDRFVAGGIDAVVFASGGTARRFAELVSGAGLDAAALLVAPLVASIGPVTTDALHELGIAVDVQAPEASVGALVGALVERFESVAR